MQISQLPHEQARRHYPGLLDSCHAPPNRPELELLDSTRILVERPSLSLSGTDYGQLVGSLTSKREGDRLADWPNCDWVIDWLGEWLILVSVQGEPHVQQSHGCRDELGTDEVAAEYVMLFLTCLPRCSLRSPTAAS